MLTIGTIPSEGAEYKREVPVKKIAVPMSEEETIVRHIKTVFGNDARTMTAIALAESNLKPKAVGYNCYYKRSPTGSFDPITAVYLDYESVSKTRLKGYVGTACKKKDREVAFSSDGGVFQINNPKPEHLEIKENIQEAKNKLDKQGLKAWTAHNTGHYKSKLKEADRLLALYK